jgi:hypothetical protein
MMWGNGYGGGFSWRMMAGEALVAILVIVGVVFAVLMVTSRAEPSQISSGTNARDSRGSIGAG